MHKSLQTFFADPGRQTLAWSGLGMVGFGLAAIGVVLFNRGGSDFVPAQAVARTTVTATATHTPTPSPTMTLTPMPTALPTATATPTRTPQRAEPASDSEAEPTPVPPTPAPTQVPLVAGGPYCPSITSTSPPNSVFGHFTIAGELAPAGTTVSLAFDGVIGPMANTTDAGGYRVDYAAAGSDCANRVGAAIAVVYDGQFFDTGHKVGDSPGAPVVFDVAVE